MIDRSKVGGGQEVGPMGTGSVYLWKRRATMAKQETG